VDIVVESGSKYLSSGSSVIGFVSFSKSRSTFYRFFSSKLQEWRRINGAVPSPFNCWIVSEHITTLPLRMTFLSRLTIEIVKFLDNLKFVNRVCYPLLPSHPSYQMAQKYFSKITDNINYNNNQKLEILGPPVLFFHLTLNSKDYSSLCGKLNKTNGNGIKFASSYGSVHSQFDIHSKTGDSNEFGCDDAQKKK